jgi:hypothetical protein
MIHFIEHALGICGDKHLSVIAVLTEWHNFGVIFNYIKLYFK